MCLIAFDWHPGSDRPLVLVANRDEFHARPTRALHWWSWPAGPLAGRDERAGGSWLAVRRDGRFAALTNVRDPDAPGGERSRGELVIDALSDDVAIEDFVHEVHDRRRAYGPFNLLVGSPEQLWQVGSHASPDRVTPGVHALSNQALDTPWPKSIRAVRRLEDALSNQALDPSALLGLLDDREPAADHELPDTGVGLALERMLSAPFIVDTDADSDGDSDGDSRRYGTRSSTALVLGRDAWMAERCFDPAGQPIGERKYSWRPA